MNLADIESKWSEVAAPLTVGEITGLRAPGLPSDRPVYLAVDDRGIRHLLIQVPESTPAISVGETRSLQITTSRFEVGPNPEALYVDLACVDPSQNPTFNAVTQDLLHTLRTSSGPIRDAVISAIARWRLFWSSLTSDLSRENAIGLFGELWFLTRWLNPLNSSIIDHWQATSGARHDFQGKGVSVEIKTAVDSTAGEPVHPITNLDQLANPERGSLYLFSLQVSEDTLSANTLHALVRRITSELGGDFKSLTDFNNKLAARGYTPSDSQHAARPLRVLAERLYQVTDDFPRVTRDTFEPLGLPPGVSSISYSLDLAACGSWLVGVAPTDSASNALRSELAE